MLSLVADYGDSEEEKSPVESTSTEDSDSEDKTKVVKLNSRQQDCKPTLPSASLMLENNKKTIPGGVFSNPFREAEEAKMASLEKHVKMVDPEHEISEQKRKVCWSYKKGRCRFGSKCSFAHDSDLILRKELHGDQAESRTDELSPRQGQSSTAESPQMVRKPRIKSKRPGLSRELVPAKKVLKMYHREKYNGKP